MGFDSWSSESYAATSRNYKTKSTAQLFSQQEVKQEYKPSEITVRESRDSDNHPNSTAIILSLDTSASMDMIADYIAKEGIGTFVNSILEESPVTDPQVMVVGNGDAFYDQAPLQVTQFETDIKMAEQTTEIWLEKGGGGNHFESYDLSWLFAALKTSIDCYEKRGKKGILFTIGDERFPSAPDQGTLKQLGFKTQMTTSEQFLEAAQEKYDVFHITVEEGRYARTYPQEVRDSWGEKLGKRAIGLSDYKYLAEVLVSVICVNEGKDAEEIAESWQDPKAVVAVKHALGV